MVGDQEGNGQSPHRKLPPYGPLGAQKVNLRGPDNGALDVSKTQ